MSAELRCFREHGRRGDQTKGAQPASRKNAWALAVLVLIAFGGGCGGLQQPQVDAVTLHVLAAKPLQRAVKLQRDAVIEVAPPRAWPGFDTPQMVYVRQPYELDYFAANRWADTPAHMLGPLLARGLEQAGSFRAVVQAPSTVAVDFRLDTEIIRLQQDFAAHPSRVEFTLRVQLTDVRAKRILASRVFQEVENVPSEDPAGGVIAANAALQRMLEQIADFCVTDSASR
jgi:cholesterol transport system auxiliary component